MTISSLMKKYFEQQLAQKLRNLAKILFEYLDSGENCENIKYHEPAKDKEEDRSDVLPSPSFSSNVSKPRPQPKLAGVDQLLLFLSWLRLGSTLKHTAWLFNLSKSIASRQIITWANFIYFKLGCVPIWPTKDIVIKTMPECFKATYPNSAQLSGQRLALGNQRFPVRVRLLAMCRGELSAVIARLMSNCL